MPFGDMAMKKFYEKVKLFFTRERGWVDGLYLGFTIALIFCTVYQHFFKYFTYNDLAKLNEISTALKKVYVEPYEKEDLTDSMYKGLFNGLDGFSYYMTKEEFNDWVNNADSNYCGIGLKWQLHEGYYVILKVYENSPADKAGIKAGDIIWSVDGKRANLVSRDKLSEEMRGKEGTNVNIVIVHDGNKIAYDLKRANIQIPNASLEIKDNVGIITIEGFDGDVVDEFHKCMLSVNEKNITNLVIDLRNNMGGSVDMLGTMMQDLVPSNEKIFSLQEKDNKETVFSVQSHTDKHFNIKILVNNFSASCSEILAGSLRDLGLAELVGMNTYGKGVIQQGYELSDGSILYLTCGHYYLPNGEPIPKDGLVPDYEVEDDALTLEDEQLDYALQLF